MIHIENTPNPNALKFLSEKKISSVGTQEFQKVNIKKFPLVKLLKKLPSESSLFETILITINDYLVFKFRIRLINLLCHWIIFNKIFHDFISYFFQLYKDTIW